LAEKGFDYSSSSGFTSFVSHKIMSQSQRQESFIKTAEFLALSRSSQNLHYLSFSKPVHLLSRSGQDSSTSVELQLELQAFPAPVKNLKLSTGYSDGHSSTPEIKLEWLTPGNPAGTMTFKYSVPDEFVVSSGGEYRQLTLLVGSSIREGSRATVQLYLSRFNAASGDIVMET